MSNQNNELISRLNEIAKEPAIAIRRSQALSLVNQIETDTKCRPLRVLVPAAGKGSRLRRDDNLPKPLVSILGRSMLARVLDQVGYLDSEPFILIRPEYVEQVSMHLDKEGCSGKVIASDEQGIGDAILAVEEFFHDLEGDVMIVWTDAMGLTKELVHLTVIMHNSLMLDKPKDHAMTFPTLRNNGHEYYVQILKKELGSIISTKCLLNREGDEREKGQELEQDCDFFLFDRRQLFKHLTKVRESLSRESQVRRREFNLLHIIERFHNTGLRVAGIPIARNSEVQGVNTPEDLKMKEILLQSRQESLTSRILDLLMLRNSSEESWVEAVSRFQKYNNLWGIEPKIIITLLEAFADATSLSLQRAVNEKLCPTHLERKQCKTCLATLGISFEV